MLLLCVVSINLSMTLACSMQVSISEALSRPVIQRSNFQCPEQADCCMPQICATNFKHLVTTRHRKAFAPANELLHPFPAKGRM